MPLRKRLRRMMWALGMSAALVFHVTASPAANKESPALPVLAKAPAASAKTQKSPATAAGEETPIEILIAQALDQKTDLHLKNIPIREAISQLADRTGIPIEIVTGTLSLLPYGSQTELSATIDGQPLRESLHAVLRPIGLRFVSKPDRVIIEATAPLRRIARRATWDELATLEKLNNNPWNKKLADSLLFQFQDCPEKDAEVNRKILYQLAESVGAGSAARVLEHACDKRGWVWRPVDRYVAIRSKTRQIEAQLSKRISCRYVQMNLRDLLLDLACRADVLLRMDPGVFLSLPPATANQFTITAQNQTIRQAFEIIAGETGLNYIIESEGVRIVADAPLAPASGDQASATAQATVNALRTNSIVGQITLPGIHNMSFAFFVRENDLPTDVNELRKDMIRQASQEIEQTLRERQPENAGQTLNAKAPASQAAQ